jgi:hypothetical protein
MQGTSGDHNRRMENKNKQKHFKVPTNKKTAYENSAQLIITNGNGQNTGKKYIYRLL